MGRGFGRNLSRDISSAFFTNLAQACNFCVICRGQELIQLKGAWLIGALSSSHD